MKNSGGAEGEVEYALALAFEDELNDECDIGALFVVKYDDAMAV